MFKIEVKHFPYLTLLTSHHGQYFKSSSILTSLKVKVRKSEQIVTWTGCMKFSS